MAGYGVRDWDAFLKKYIDGYTDFNWEDVRNNISILPIEVLENILKLYESNFDIDMHQLRYKKEKKIQRQVKKEQHEKEVNDMEYRTYQRKFLDEYFPQYRYRYDILQKKGHYYLPEPLRSYMHAYYNRGNCKDKDRYRRPYDMKCVKPCKTKGKDNIFTKKGCVKVTCDEGKVYDYIEGNCRPLYSNKDYRTLFNVIITLLTNFREGSVDIVKQDNDPIPFDFKFMDDDESIYFKYIDEIPDKDFEYYGKIKGNRMTPETLIQTFNMILKLYFTNFYYVAVKNNFEYITKKMYNGFDWKKYMTEDTKVFYDTLYPPQKGRDVGKVKNELLKYVKGKNKRMQMDIYIMDGYAWYMFDKYISYFDNGSDRTIFSNVYRKGYKNTGLSYFAFTSHYTMPDRDLNKLMLGLLKIPIKELKMEHRRYKKGIKHMRTTLMNLLNVSKKNLDDDKKRFMAKLNKNIRDMCPEGKSINPNTGKCRNICPKDTHVRNALDRCVKKCKKGYIRVNGRGRCRNKNNIK